MNLLKYTPVTIYFMYISFVLYLRLFALDGAMFNDNIEMISHVYWSFNYNMSHPPLMNWVYRIFAELANWNWLVVDVALKMVAHGSAAFLMWDAARRVSGPLAGVCVLAGLAALSSVSMSLLFDGSHSLGVLMGTAIVIHALALLHVRQTASRFVWMGLGLVIGLLSKYNYAIFTPCLLLSIWLLKPYGDRTGQIIYVLAAAVALAAPVYLFQLFEFPEETTARLHKLGEDNLGNFRGAYGLINLASHIIKICLQYIAPFAALVVFCGPRHIVQTLFLHPLVSVILLTLILFVLSCAGVLIVLDAARFNLSYLLPGLLFGLCMLGMLVCSRRRAAVTFVVLALAAIPLELTGHHQFTKFIYTAHFIHTTDYRPAASEIRNHIDGPLRVIGDYRVAGRIQAILTPRVSLQRTDPQNETPVYVWLEAMPNEIRNSHLQLARLSQEFLQDRLLENKSCHLADDLFTGAHMAFVCYATGV